MLQSSPSISPKVSIRTARQYRLHSPTTLLTDGQVFCCARRLLPIIEHLVGDRNTMTITTTVWTMGHTQRWNKFRCIYDYNKLPLLLKLLLLLILLFYAFRTLPPKLPARTTSARTLWSCLLTMVHAQSRTTWLERLADRRCSAGTL